MKVIPKQVIEEIRAANDIVEVLGTYLQLKRAGSNFKALCPFHKEKTPSFMVNPQRQIYHCFGCGAGGDVFRFVMEYEGLDFMGATHMLADRAGIVLQMEDEDRQAGVEKDLLYRLHEEVTMFFHRVLVEHADGASAREYLVRRRLDQATIEDFLMGFAPDRWDTMGRLAGKKHFSMEQMLACGLVLQTDQPREGESPYHDRFRGRLMFPIRDEIGRVIGFSGRILDDSKKLAKYVNSPETPLFHKSRVLFAFDKARKAIVDERTAVVVEGQIDAIRCHCAGLTNVVASQGTALTGDHARMLKRYADTVVLVLDADEAGREAALRSIEHFMSAGLALRIAALPAGEDPDSLVLKQGPEAIRKLVDEAPEALDFQMDVLAAREDLKTEAGLMRTARSALETIRHAPSAMLRDRLLRHAAERLGLSELALREDLERLLRARPGAPPPARGETDAPPPRAEHPPEEVALAEMLILHPEVIELFSRYLKLEHLSDAVCRTLAERLLAHAGDEHWNLVSDLEGADEETVRLAAQVQMAPIKITGEEFSAENAAKDLILVITRKACERERAALREKMKRAPEAEREKLSIECQHLAVTINTLRQGWDKALPILEL
ncbi:MAG: DNA primase [Kiritimatiellae bacterium]|nr:DNA primase [Kiritimatiellia bacterium]